MARMGWKGERRTNRYRKLIDLGIAISAERRLSRLMEIILLGAMDVGCADGGTLYLRQGNELRFSLVRNRSLDLALGGTTGKDIPYPPLALYDAAGHPNRHNVATYAALSGETINIDDAYDDSRFDFAGTRHFDGLTRYRSKSFLTVPLRNREKKVIGVIQLINALDASGAVVAFPDDLIPIMDALAAQAAVAVMNRELVSEQFNLGIALATERNQGRLMEKILLGAKALSGADGGALFYRSGDELRFVVMHTDSLGIALGGSTGKDIPYPPLRLRDDGGAPNFHNVASYAALTGETVDIADAYNDSRFDFSGTRAFDAGTGYRSKSFLTVPLKNKDEKIVGVLELINALDHHGNVVPFADDIVPIIEALATQAAVAVENQYLVNQQIHLGIALSTERSHGRLMERILLGAKDLSNADGGTLYLEKAGRLQFVIMHNDTLGIAMGGTTGKDIPYPPLPLHDDSGRPNHRNIATHAALTGEMVNIVDAYDENRFDFSGTRKFDALTGYRSQSFLTVPLKNHDGSVIGVLQLINARSPSGKVVAFSDEIAPVVEALASQAAVALDNYNLLQAQKDLLDSFIKVIASAIDAKSPYTGGHCQRVPVLTDLLARAAAGCKDGPFAGFDLDDDGWYELHIASWLHDCGKVSTPEYVVDKATKLETIFDRIHLVRGRVEAAKRQAEVAYLRAVLAGGDKIRLEAEYEAEVAALEADFAFLEGANVGGEFMSADKIERLGRIAQRRWRDGNRELPLLTENEIYNLSIPRGTLTAEERKVINDHIVVTIQMLEELPFPDTMKNVVEYAGGHHEKMDGTGYPRGLKRGDMSIPARIMAIADIFEALTAADRPYKSGKTLSEAIRIMHFMRRDRHIDPDLFELFLTSGVWRDYARRFLRPDQIDEVDISQYLEARTAAQ